MTERRPLAKMPQSREVRITFRDTEDAAEELKQDAASEEIPLSWLIRRRLRMGKSMEQAMGGRKAASA
jgi:hypothetical protein